MTPEKPRHDGEWVCVPCEPTEEMIAAGWIDTDSVTPRDIYKAMLAVSTAAPELVTELANISPASAALGTHEGEPLLNELVRLRRDVARLTELEAHIRELENLTASHARTIEALRAAIKWADDLYAALACLRATHNEIWNNQCEEAYRGYADASNARTLKEHPNG